MNIAASEAPRLGLEPRTYRLTAGRSTIELSGNETGLILTHSLVKALLPIAVSVPSPTQTQSHHDWSFDRSEPGNRSAQKPLSDRRWLAALVSTGLVSASSCDAVSSLSPGLATRVRELRRNRAGSAIDAIRRESAGVPAPAPTAGWPGVPVSASVKASSSSGSIPTRCAAAATVRLRRPDRASSRMRTVSALDGGPIAPARSTGTEQ